MIPQAGRRVRLFDARRSGEDRRLEHSDGTCHLEVCGRKRSLVAHQLGDTSRSLLGEWAWSLPVWLTTGYRTA